MGEMVGLATSVTGIECATPLEAEVRELRLIAEHKPRYNRRSRFPEKVHFVKLTREGTAPALAGASNPRRRRRLPRPVLVAQDGREVPGRAARHVPGAPVQRPDATAVPSGSPCVLAEMGRCLSRVTAPRGLRDLRRLVRQLRDTLLRRPDRVVEVINERMQTLADHERFEEAGVHRDRLATFVRAAARCPAALRPHPVPRRWSPRAGTRGTGRSTSSGSGAWRPPG